ncbi:MAG TPA: prephenate dehydratase [bacterium]|nr:prephenate dehydratase [bacterium]
MTPAARIAFQGEPGAYSDEALGARFGEIERLPRRSLSAVFAAVASGEATAGIVPVENSYAGSINETYDLLLTSPLVIVGELTHAVNHCLLALPGETIGTVVRVLSHPQALAQCAAFIDDHGWQTLPEYDTAGSARRVAEERLAGSAAIASRRASELYGLDILAEGIQTAARNLTRFLLLAREPVPPSVPAKTSLVFGTANAPGALHRALGVFAARGLNLSKLESRPARDLSAADADWEYIFYVDIDAHASERPMAAALVELRAAATFVRVLGAYPRAAG